MKDTFYLNISSADNLGIGLFKYALTPEEKFIITNSTLAQMLGYASKAEFKKLKLDKFFYNSKDKEEFLRILRKDSKVKFFETIFKDRKGKIIWVALTASRVISQGKREYFEGIIEDISCHKEMEERLFLEREFLQGLLDNIPDMIYFKDLQNRFVLVNKAHAEALNLTPEQVIGKSDLDFFPKELAEKYFADDNYVIKMGSPIVGKIEKAPRPDGGITYVSTTKVPHYDKDGKIIGTMGVTRNVTVHVNLEEERLNMAINALTVLGKVLEMRDPYTSSHTQNVACIAERIGRRLNWDDNRLLGVRLAGELHDLGKISIPLDILNKPGKLSDLEYRLIQEHVRNCYDIIKDIEFPFSLAEIIYQHHERLDGSGYPRGLKEDEILPEARILAICDVLEAMTSYRPYREALGLDKALAELKDNCNFKYDRAIVEVVLGLINENDGKAFWINN
jgi:PAS domain S-box-containing protein